MPMEGMIPAMAVMVTMVVMSAAGTTGAPVLIPQPLHCFLEHVAPSMECVYVPDIDNQHCQ